MTKRAPEKLAVFDFDHTLTSKDTTLYFLKYYAGPIKAYSALFSNLPALLMAMNGVSTWRNVKERIFKSVFGGHTPEMIAPYGKSFAEIEIPAILIAKVWQQLNQLRSNGYEIALLSASCSIWLRHWCELENITLLCTELEIVNNQLTGKIAGENCYGAEKVVRLKEMYELDKVKHMVAYGNHKSDFYYMDLAHEAYLVKGNEVEQYERRR